MLTKHIAMKSLNVEATQYRNPQSHVSCLSSSTGERQKSKVVYLLLFSFVLFGAGLVGCSTSGFLGIGGNVTKIGNIQQNQNNGNSTVYLQGEVTTRAPFLGSGAYKLKDASGTIWVIANQTLPNVGDQVLIKGQLQFQSIPVAGQELGEVYVQQEQQLKRKEGKAQSPKQEKKQ